MEDPLAGLLSDDEEGITKKPPGTESKAASEKSPALARDQGREGGLVSCSKEDAVGSLLTRPPGVSQDQYPGSKDYSSLRTGVGCASLGVGQGWGLVRSCGQTRCVQCLLPHPKVKVAEKRVPLPIQTSQWRARQLGTVPCVLNLRSLHSSNSWGHPCPKERRIVL